MRAFLSVSRAFVLRTEGSVLSFLELQNSDVKLRRLREAPRHVAADRFGSSATQVSVGKATSTNPLSFRMGRVLGQMMSGSWGSKGESWVILTCLGESELVPSGWI